MKKKAVNEREPNNLNLSTLNIEVEEVDWHKWQRLINICAEMLNAPAMIINRVTPEGVEKFLASQTCQKQLDTNQFNMDHNKFCLNVITESQILYVKDIREDCRYQKEEMPYLSYLGLPITWPDGSIFGSLSVLDTQTTNYPDEYIDALSVIKEVIDSDLRHLYKEDQLLKMSYTDPLTQIYNRRGLIDLLQSTQDLARRLKRQLILIYFDLDKFKTANDKYGHDMGDKLLNLFAMNLKKNSRSCDLVARWGGDEFIVIIHAEDIESIKVYIDRMNQHLADQTYLPEIHFSYGYAVIKPDDSSTLAQLLSTADENMYRNKQLKRTDHKK
ncbi:GGDEF domain-containing protein [Shewanella woodyi]|uniref:diguanylate cyclase n=1 Tax=Shewanella woodyi (strain ATCC 51908 / MS32) TaxID=392500 RepID=B1KMM4_SHEWM|nr:GGDEF domain-containing protein [Shewanella woodyi]ACA87402.1 diguanylate cyclase [Shewanella woodyi ATCC 51908]